MIWGAMDISEKYQQLWRTWNVHVLILLSLSMQIILFFLGLLRKKITLRWIQMILWGTYILAEWVANFTLGQLSSSMGDYSSNVIIAFWAPFLILHLGGPDTITAYSMEDNELWDRHLVGLIYELIVAFYILFQSLPNTILLTPTLLIFSVAIIKYVERSYSFYKASAEGFCKSINSSAKRLLMDDLNPLNQAFGLYFACKPFFIDLIPHMELYAKTRNFIKKMTTEEVLRATSMELSFAYDEFYTKAIINHARIGYVLRVLCSICILLAFWLFHVSPKNGFDKFDVAITYVLLTTSICLDIMATIMLVISDWMVVSLLNVKKPGNLSVFLAKFFVRIKKVWHKRGYWVAEIPQLNLLSNCLNICSPSETLQQRIMNWIMVKLCFEQETKLYPGCRSTVNDIYTLRTLQPIQATEEIMKIIASYAQKCLTIAPDDSDALTYIQLLKFNKLAGLSALKQIIHWAIPIFIKLLDGLSLDQQVFVWHITTELCFHWNPKSLHPLYPHQREMKEEENISIIKRKCLEMEACKYLSNYMMHMIFMRPEMMSTMVEASPILFYHAFYDMVQLIHKDKMQNTEVKEVCRKIMATPIVCQDNNKSLFVTARVLANLMLVIGETERWEVLIMMWVELLMQVAKNSRANMHVNQLSNGGDLLTFIWLLNKHMEIDDMFDDIVDTLGNQPVMVEQILLNIKIQL